MPPSESPAHRSRRGFVRDGVAALAALCVAPLGAHAEGPGTAPARQARMLRRTIPSSRESIPAIGMGTWQTFDPPRLDAESLAPLEEVLRIFYDAGGRVVDSSPMYGRSEEVTGRLSTRLGINDDLWIATKVWTRGERAGVRQMETSLGELQRRRIELMQVHNLVDWRTHLDTLRAWKDEGRIRYIGITHYQTGAFAELERIMSTERLDFVQLPYSIVLRDAERRLLPLARDRGIAVLVNRPFEGGDLFGRVRGRELPDFVRPFAASWAQAFLKFLLAHPAVTAVIPATSKPRNMRDNVGAGIGPLPDEAARERLAKLFA